jgi:hypothetical protein
MMDHKMKKLEATFSFELACGFRWDDGILYVESRGNEEWFIDPEILMRNTVEEIIYKYHDGHCDKES